MAQYDPLGQMFTSPRFADEEGATVEDWRTRFNFQKPKKEEEFFLILLWSVFCLCMLGPFLPVNISPRLNKKSMPGFHAMT